MTNMTKKKIKKNVEYFPLLLIGVQYVTIKEVTTTKEITYQINEKGVSDKKLSSKTIDYACRELRLSLTQVTKDELLKYRKKKIPSLVIKVDGKLYYTKIPKTLNLTTSRFQTEHLCSKLGYICQHLSAASDENGGCQKVREYSTGIERYPWITDGYESFGTKFNVFSVSKCEHYEECERKEEIPILKINNLKVGLAQFIWDDVKTIQEVKMRYASRLR